MSSPFGREMIKKLKEWKDAKQRIRRTKIDIDAISEKLREVIGYGEYLFDPWVTFFQEKVAVKLERVEEKLVYTAPSSGSIRVDAGMQWVRAEPATGNTYYYTDTNTTIYNTTTGTAG